MGLSDIIWRGDFKSVSQQFLRAVLIEIFIYAELLADLWQARKK